VRRIDGFYDLMGNGPEKPGTVAEMAAYLLRSGATIIDIAQALDCCVRECRYPVRLHDIMQRLPGGGVPHMEAEMRAAWDEALRHRKYLRWNCEYDYAYPEPGAPQLPQRIVDCVRRGGGWESVLNMGPEDFPFVQKRFFDEYKAWDAVQKGEPAKFAQLPPPAQKRLQVMAAGKSMDAGTTDERPPTDAELAEQQRKLNEKFGWWKPKPVVTPPLSREEFRERKAELKAQAERIAAAKKASFADDGKRA
jgi:hypothetical protein